MRYVDDNELKLISWDNDTYEPKYIDMYDFIEKNFDKLLNHKIDNSDIPILSEYLISEFMYYYTERLLKEDIFDFYQYLFLYIYAPEIQSYHLKSEIFISLSGVESNIKNLKRLNLFDNNIKNKIIEYGNEAIDEINYYLKTWMETEPKVTLPNIKDAYINDDYIYEIIRDFAVEENLVEEYGNWQPVPEEFFKDLGGKYNEW